MILTEIRLMLVLILNHWRILTPTFSCLCPWNRKKTNKTNSYNYNLHSFPFPQCWWFTHRKSLAGLKPILINIKCFKDYQKLTCMLSVSNFRTFEVVKSRCKLLPKGSQDNLSLTAIAVRFYVPQTLRIRFLANQLELFSQNTCCLHRRVCADRVTVRVDPEQRREKANLFKCFQPCISHETDPLSSRTCGSSKNYSPTSSLHTNTTPNKKNSGFWH
jgi:hypothetical protein